MTPELATELDDRLAFVLGNRFLQALRSRRWDRAVRAIELLEPVVTRLGKEVREREFARYVVMLGLKLPTFHPRKEEFVQRADNQNERKEKVDEIPIGLMTPLALPVDGQVMNEDTARGDSNTVRVTFSEFSAAIRAAKTNVIVSEPRYFPGWHLIEYQPYENDLPVASRAFFVKGGDVAQIDGNPAVFDAIARRDGINLATEEIARSYLCMYVAGSQTGLGIASRVVEPGNTLPFREDIDDATKAAARDKLELCEVRVADNGGYSGSGTLTLGGTLAHFDVTIEAEGKVHINKLTPIFPEPSQGEVQPILLDYVYVPPGWRVLGFRKPQFLENDPVASGEKPPTELPTTLPSVEESEGVMDRPCVVAPPNISTFSGLSLRKPNEEENSLVLAIPQYFPTGAIRDFQLDAARVAELPFVPAFLLALVPNRDTAVFVPFIISKTSAQLVGRQNNWLYDLMQRNGGVPRVEVLPAYVHFFFSVVVGRLGKFMVIESAGEIPWSQEATEADKKRVEDIITPIRYLGRLGDGQHVLSMHIVFKNALFRTNCQIDPNWTTKLTNEDLILEEQPFLQGAAFNLTVYR